MGFQIPKSATKSVEDCEKFLLSNDERIKKNPKMVARAASAFLGTDGEKIVAAAYNKAFEGTKYDYHKTIATIAQTRHHAKVAVAGIAALGIGIVGTSEYDASKQRRIAREEAMLPQQRQQWMAAPQNTSQQAYPQSTRTQ